MTTTIFRRSHPSRAIQRTPSLVRLARALTAGARAFLEGCSWELIEREGAHACPTCHDFVPGDHRCWNQQQGICIGCGEFWLDLDGYGHCPVDPHHEILKRRFKHPDVRWGGAA